MRDILYRKHSKEDTDITHLTLMCSRAQKFKCGETGKHQVASYKEYSDLKMMYVRLVHATGTCY